jgi:hypothetical protein
LLRDALMAAAELLDQNYRQICEVARANSRACVE